MILLQAEHLQKTHGMKVIFDDLSLSIASGEKIGLIGVNGTGKSTLLRAISGVQPVMSGRITIDGRDVKEYTPARMALTVATVTTERVRVADLRCRDVVALGRAPYTNWIGRMQQSDAEIVEQSLATVGMADYADRTMDRMSDGECQRIMIARALAQQTPVILLDEPTAFLDMPNRYELCTLLAELAHGQDKCILFSTHELDIALNLCDDIALIAPPHLYLQTAEQTVRSGHLERLFASANVTFDPATRSVTVKR